MSRRTWPVVLLCFAALGACADGPADPAPEAPELATVEGAIALCTSDADCEDGDACTTDACLDGLCVSKDKGPSCCTSSADCEPGPCQTASCEVLPGRPYGTCIAAQIPGCCSGVAGCNDGDPCTMDACDPATAQCMHLPVSGCCVSAADCDDGLACTGDRCIGNVCVFKPLSSGGCCALTADCEDGNPCTKNSCDPATHTCSSEPVTPGGGVICCESSADCADGDPCTKEACVKGQCAYRQLAPSTCLPPGESCAKPLPVGALPFVAVGDTSDAANDHTAPVGCGTAGAAGGGSADEVYAFTPVQSGDYVITLEPGYDALLYVQLGCGAVAGCVDASDVIGIGTEQVTLTAQGGTTYFIVVDGWSDTANVAGPYELTVDKVAPPQGTLVINEVDYDQPSTDALEFIELYNPGPGPVILSEWTLEHVNGSNNTVVFTVPLAGAGAALAAGAYLVVGNPNLVATLPPTTAKISFTANTLQNGAPDGVRLLKNGVFADGVAWEGVMAGTGEGSTAGADLGAGNDSLSRCENGKDTNDNGADFVVTTSTPGAKNACEPAPPVVTFSDVAPIYQAKCTPCHTDFGFGSHNIGSADVAVGYSDSQLQSYYVPGATKGAATLVRIKDGSMPMGQGCTGDPAADAGNPACLTKAEQDLIQAWITGGQLAPAP